MPSHQPKSALCAAVILLAATGLSDAGSAQRGERFVAGGWQVEVRPAPRRSVTRGIETGALPVTGVDPGSTQSGLASFYWQGTQTASGEPFDRHAMTAAHRTLPFGTQVRVTHVASGRVVVVRINDRGPFKAGRIIDLTERAAHVLGMAQQGLARVRVDVLDPNDAVSR